MYLKDKGQVLISFVIFSMLLCLCMFFIYETCQFYALNIKTQKVADEVAKKAGEIQLKEIRFLVMSNQILVFFHASLRSLQVLALAGGISEALFLALEASLKKAIYSLATLQDQSLKLSLYASLIPYLKYKFQFLPMTISLKPYLVGGEREKENTLEYHIKRKKILDLPGPYVLEDHFFEKQKIFVRARYFYLDSILKDFFKEDFFHIEKISEIGLAGGSLFSQKWKTVYLQ